jgi:hypothetical protein
MQRLQVQDGIGAHMGVIVYNAYDGTSIEPPDAGLVGVPFGTFGTKVRRAAAPLRTLHAELVTISDYIIALAKIPGHPLT